MQRTVKTTVSWFYFQKKGSCHWVSEDHLFCHNKQGRIRNKFYLRNKWITWPGYNSIYLCCYFFWKVPFSWCASLNLVLLFMMKKAIVLALVHGNESYVQWNFVDLRCQSVCCFGLAFFKAMSKNRRKRVCRKRGRFSINCFCCCCCLFVCSFIQTWLLVWSH